MKLSSQDTSQLINILTTCAVGNVESFVIIDGTLRAVNQDRTYAIISDKNIPKFPQKIGFSRVNALKQRLDFFANSADTIIDAKETEREEINSLEISAGKNKVQFRCTSTALIKYPKGMHDLTAAFKIYLESVDERKTLISGIKMMNGSTVQLTIHKNREVEFKAIDDTNDAFSSIISTPVEVFSSEHDSVVLCYHADIFLSVLRASSLQNSVVLSIGKAGSITTDINGHNVIILPKVNESEED